MTETLETLSRRAATLQSIHGVVRTMKALAAVNAAPYERAAGSIDAFQAVVLDGLQVWARSQPVLSEAPAGRRGPKVALVFGSDHGLCGGYNETVARAALALTAAAGEWHVIAVGARLQASLTAAGSPPARLSSTAASMDGVGRLAGEILVALDEVRADAPHGDIAVTMVHMQRGAQARQDVITRPLLPLEPAFLKRLAERPWPSRSLPVLTMPPDELFSELLRNHLFVSVFRAVCEAMAAENAARLALMQQAEHAIDERLDELQATTRSVRQTQITEEILDLIGGFEALTSRRHRDKFQHNPAPNLGGDD